MVKLNTLVADAEPFGATCLFLVDACRDDPNRVARSTSIQGKEARLTTKTAVPFSCGSGQFAYQHKEKGHGVFTFAALTAMRISYARYCRAADRNGSSPDYRGSYLGFRLCFRLD